MSQDVGAPPGSPLPDDGKFPSPHATITFSFPFCDASLKTALPQLSTNAHFARCAAKASCATRRRSLCGHRVPLLRPTAAM